MLHLDVDADLDINNCLAYSEVSGYDDYFQKTLFKCDFGDGMS